MTMDAMGLDLQIDRIIDDPQGLVPEKNWLFYVVIGLLLVCVGFMGWATVRGRRMRMRRMRMRRRKRGDNDDNDDVKGGGGEGIAGKVGAVWDVR